MHGLHKYKRYVLSILWLWLCAVAVCKKDTLCTLCMPCTQSQQDIISSLFN